MPDKRKHRGPNPADIEDFAPRHHDSLREAVRHLSWLLGHGYAEVSALKLVGDRFALTARQRLAARRCACSDAELASRTARRADASALAGRPLEIDGYNVLTTIEAALAGGVLLLGRDGSLRDMASMHGSYRLVEETLPALTLLGECLHNLQITSCHWYLDRPVSNSGRLATKMGALAEARAWPWQVSIVDDPDRVLERSPDLAATADRGILDVCEQWFPLARHVVEAMNGLERAVDLAG